MGRTERCPKYLCLEFPNPTSPDSYISKSTTVKKKLIRPTKGGQVGLGGYLFNDQNGIMRRTGLQAAYSYTIPLGENENELRKNLAFG
jgi:hypothetical protein